MEPDNSNNPDQTVDSTKTPDLPTQQIETYAPEPKAEQTVQQPTDSKQEQQLLITAQAPKKSPKKLFIIFGIIIAITIVAVASYFVYGYYNPVTKTTNTADEKTTTATTNKTNKDSNPTIDAASATLTGGATNESDIMNTDDSNIASDASDAAGNVGDSVDENNF